jgi:hypothetical protein
MDMSEKITPRLVQEEIEKACQEHGANFDTTVFGLQKKQSLADLDKARFSRRVAIAGIIKRTGATQTAIAEAWGCDIDFILKAYPHGAFESKGLTQERFNELADIIAIQRDIDRAEILNFSARGVASPARLDLIELVITETFATPTEIADRWGCTRKQVTDYLEERKINRMTLILKALRGHSATQLAKMENANGR